LIGLGASRKREQFSLWVTAYRIFTRSELCSDLKKLESKLSARQWTQTGEMVPEFYMD